MRIDYKGTRSGETRVAIITYGDSEENAAYDIAHEIRVATSYKVDTSVYGMLIVDIDDINDYNNFKEYYKEFKKTALSKHTAEQPEAEAEEQTEAEQPEAEQTEANTIMKVYTNIKKLSDNYYELEYYALRNNKIVGHGFEDFTRERIKTAVKFYDVKLLTGDSVTTTTGTTRRKKETLSHVVAVPASVKKSDVLAFVSLEYGENVEISKTYPRFFFYENFDSTIKNFIEHTVEPVQPEAEEQSEEEQPESEQPEAEQTEAEQTEAEAEPTYASDTLSGSNVGLKALNELDTDSRRSEIRNVLEVLDKGITFYQVSERDGILKGVNKITKNGEDSYTVNGVELCTLDVIRKIRDGSKEFTSSQPDTSSHVKITGTTTQTIDGLKFKDGIFDIIQYINLYGKECCRKARKVERTGKITTYNGEQYGVNKNSGEYFTTHIPTGILIGGGQKNMSGVVSQIKETSERLLNMDLRKEIESFNNMIRGHEESAEQQEAEQPEAELTEAETKTSKQSEHNKVYIVRAFKNEKELTVQCPYFPKREYAIDYINNLCENGVVSRDVVFTINNSDIYDCFSDVKMEGTTAQVKFATDCLNEHYKRLCNDIALEYKMRIFDDIDVESKDYYANLSTYITILKKVLNCNRAKSVITNCDRFEAWGDIHITAMNFIRVYNDDEPYWDIKHLESKLRKELFKDIQKIF